MPVFPVHVLMRCVRIERLEDGTYFASIPRIRGVWANAKSKPGCIRELRSVIEEWTILQTALNSARRR